MFFRLKIKKLYKSLLEHLDLKDINLTNATTLFSDGAIAYRIKKSFEIPYIVTVRHTDVNLFIKYRPDLINMGIKILSGASKIIFISSSLRELLYNHSKFKKYRLNFDGKTEIIHNGIDDFWLKNLNIRNNTNENKFLFVGRFDKYKNTINLISALKEARKTFPDIKLSLVGGGGSKSKEILDLIETNKNWIHFYGKIYNKTKLMEIYRSHKYYAMVSIFETFGLVYIEALSQGLPVLFTKNQGIDGLFDIEVGEAAYPKDIMDIEEKAISIIKNHGKMEIDKINFKDFSWHQIALKYEELFYSLSR